MRLACSCLGDVPAGVIMSQPGSNFPQLVNDLVGLQRQVQQYAPQLSSQWGWLAAQGQKLAAGQPASITQDQWVAQYRSFFAALQDGEPDQQSMVSQAFFSNIGSDASQGFSQAGQVLENEATDVAQGATNLTTAAGQGFGTAFDFAQFLAQYWPWLAIGAAALIVVPLIVGELRK